MNAFEADYKRSRPLLGTFFSISLQNPTASGGNEIDLVMNEAFDETARLEKIFSRLTGESRLSVINTEKLNSWVEVEMEFYFLLKVALELWKESKGAFNPFFPVSWCTTLSPIGFNQRDGRFLIRKELPIALDLSGIAKGYIVDRVVDQIRRLSPESAGVVNAGGDLRFFNKADRRVSLRLGARSAPVYRTLMAPSNGVATSSLSEALTGSGSSSRYAPTAPGGAFDAATVIARSCCVADGLTKVALYGEKATVLHCAKIFGAQMLLFDSEGSLLEAVGETTGDS